MTLPKRGETPLACMNFSRWHCILRHFFHFYTIKSSLTTINDTLKSSADLLAFIDSKRKVLYIEDHTPKPLESYELKYFQEAQERVIKVLHEKLEEVSNKLATTLINLKKKGPSRVGEDQQSRRGKENKRKVKKIKGETFTTEPGILLLEKLTSI